jgi:hypothetical protein
LKASSKAWSGGIAHGLRVRWAEARAVELVLESIAGEFGGEDPLKPALRTVLTEARQKLRELSREFPSPARDVELPEPGEDELDQVATLVERAQRLFADA